MNILFACSELYPLIKTGGLADFALELPRAIRSHGHDIRVIIPGYSQIYQRVESVRHVLDIKLPLFSNSIRILQGQLLGSNFPIYFVDSKEHFDRDGGPYSMPDGVDWPDNAERFTLFNQAVTELAKVGISSEWKPDIVHCNDWHTGLIPALLDANGSKVLSLFTVHNLAYQGLFPYEEMNNLLKSSRVKSELFEFHGQFSFLKGGIAGATEITTVSPTYAMEICTAEYGYGLEGLFTQRKDSLTGIVNGVDYDIWGPQHDPFIQRTYSVAANLKQNVKKDLQLEVGLPERDDVMLLGYVGRLAEQKGTDLIISEIDKILDQPVQLMVLGVGDPRIEENLCRIAKKYPGQFAAKIGYSESLAHQITAGADCFLMPSRFEPCGLNQIYALRCGTIPIVRKTGGLADTVESLAADNSNSESATGFVFDNPTGGELSQCIEQASTIFRIKQQWNKLMTNAMGMDYSWKECSSKYVAIYERLITESKSVESIDRVSTAVPRESKETFRQNIEKTTIPRELIESIGDGDCVLVVGAGLSKNCGLPTWDELMQPLAKELSVSLQEDLLDIAQVYEKRFGRRRMLDMICEQIDTAGMVPSDTHKLLIDLEPEIVITTNYDDLIEKSFDDKGIKIALIVNDIDIPNIKSRNCVFWRS